MLRHLIPTSTFVRLVILLTEMVPGESSRDFSCGLDYTTCRVDLIGIREALTGCYILASYLCCGEIKKARNRRTERDENESNAFACLIIGCFCFPQKPHSDSRYKDVTFEKNHFLSNNQLNSVLCGIKQRNSEKSKQPDKKLDQWRRLVTNTFIRIPLIFRLHFTRIYCKTFHCQLLEEQNQPQLTNWPFGETCKKTAAPSVRPPRRRPLRKFIITKCPKN